MKRKIEMLMAEGKGAKNLQVKRKHKIELVKVNHNILLE